MNVNRNVLLERNVSYWLIRAFLNNLLFFLPIWYSFETQYLSGTQLGLLYGATMLVTVLAEIPTGMVADVLGRRRSVILGFLAQALGWTIVGAAQSPMYLVIGYFIWAISASFISGAMTALDYDTLKELKKEDNFAVWMSKAGLLESIALLISTIAGGYLFAWWTRSPYFGVAVASLIAAFFTFLSVEPKGGRSGVSFSVFIRESQKTLQHIWSNKYNRYFAGLYVFIASFSFSFIYVFGLVYSTVLIPNDATRGIVLGVMVFLTASLTNLLARFLIKNKRLTISIEVAAIIIGYLGMGMGYGWFGLIWLFLLYTSGSLRFALFEQFANEIMPSEYRATGLSILNMGAGIIDFIAMSLGMYLIEIFGQQRTFTGIGLIALLLGSYFLARLNHFVKK